MQLSQQIRDYYFAHFDEMDFLGQFHFASRLATWNNDAEARGIIEQFKVRVAPNAEQALLQVIELSTSPPTLQINALASRQPYFDAYPYLQGLHLALFRLRHLKFIYDIDLTEDFLNTYPKDKLLEIARTLEEDDGALLVLSTFAINCIFLIRYILYPTGSSEPFVKHVYNLAGSVDHDTPEAIQLLIYLYTHCIIGDTNFYNRPVSNENIPIFTTMLDDLSSVIRDNYDQIHLDNKFEYLVSCRILNYSPDPEIESAIYKEAEKSLSDKGTFLIDRHNTFPQQMRTSFNTSEHRNVLYIMSCSSYPHSHRR